MARVDVVMPQMGESIAEGTLSKWLKKVGDQVKRDEPIFEISTDKVDAEIPAPSSGVLAEILVTEGQTVAVQTVVARLETDVNAAIVCALPRRAGCRGGRPQRRRRRRGAPPTHSCTACPAAPRRTRRAAHANGGNPSKIVFARSRRRSSDAWPPSTASR